MRGFTLIETIIYLGLYAIIMGGALVAAYSIFESSAHNQTRALVQEEGNFLIAKVGWTLDGITAITEPVLTGTATTSDAQALQVVKPDGVGALRIVLSGNDLIFTKNGTDSTLNNTNVGISGTPLITRVRASTDGINAESITARFTVTATTSDGFTYSQEFVTTKYLRK